jgi:hypothetical protein
MGSYNRAHTKTWLDEYRKDGGLSGKPRSTLLLDQRQLMDGETGKWTSASESPPSEEPSLADLVSRYQVMASKSWSQEQIEELQFDSKSGRIVYRFQCLVEGGDELEKRMRPLSSGESFGLLSVAEDSNSIYLTIIGDSDHGRDVRVICVPPFETRNVRALKELEPIYLCAGTYDSAKEALEHARKLDVEKKRTYGRSEWMVWSVFHAETEKTDYSVVLTYSDSAIGSNFRGKGQQRFGLNLVPITSEGFREWLVHTESP